jgi:HK97 family phage prohead protease
MELRALSSEDKSAIKSELKNMPMDDLVATHRRLHQWAAQGNVLSGFTKQDMEWLHNAVEAELRQRAKEDDREPPEPSPLEWGRSDPEESEGGDDERWLPKTVKKIIALAKKKKRSSGGDVERRFISGELRAVDNDGQRSIVGYAAVFNQLSEDLGGFREIVLPGAFTNALEADVRALFNHDPSQILGRTTAGTLVLSEDDIGLRYEISPPDTQYAKDLLVSIDRGDVAESSFSFRAVEESWRNPTESQPLPVRILHEVNLFDVSPATFPAYPTTSAQVRDVAAWLLASAGRATGEDADPERAARRLALRKRQLELVERL